MDSSQSSGVDRSRAFAAGSASDADSIPAQGVSRTPPEDAVAGVLRLWAEVHPELDTEPIGVLGRINRCAALLQHVTDAPLGDAGLTRPEFDILSALRRVGAEMTPGRLARETFASPAAVTKRVRGLADRGLVTRRADGRDRRVAHIGLADEGRELVDRVLPQQLSYERALLSGLPPGDRAELAAILGDLLLLLEGRLGSLGH
ncbi:MarR family winged helix-turn-helix transcriptional regulator [Nocardia sp. BMG51109]|uniref:MarR family winged helix-turn-helix transcriptional regulator n=1 Tax=Nocardia sp. BMG51109 TaxID=1056816 RepID=UPI000A012372|nr:MarR family transcriptional regulator [Nocardia sp. BMG51109]